MNPKKFQRERQHKINSEVRFPQVRVIGDNAGVMTSYEASKLAEAQGKDLILINENQNPPIVRIEEYTKFLYNIEKAEKEKKKNTAKTETKEIQLSCDIFINDLETKAKKAKEFLESGDKVKVVIQLKGRQKQTPERGEYKIIEFIQLLEKLSAPGTPEDVPKNDNNKWLVIIKPIKNDKNKPTKTEPNRK